VAGDRPDVAYISTVEHSLLGLWADAHENWVVADAFYNGTFQVWTKAEHQERSFFHPSKARDVIDHATDTQMAYNPKIKRRPIGKGNGPEKAADDIENGLEAILLDAFLREMEHPAKRGGKNMLLYGYNNYEAPLMNLDGAPKEPEIKPGESGDEFEGRMNQWEADKAGWNPFRVRVSNPSRILLDPTERVPTMGIKRGFWFAKDLKRIAKQSGSTWSAGEAKPFDRFKLVDYYDEDHHVVVVSRVGNDGAVTHSEQVSGDIFLEEDNNYGYVPFTHAYSGFGFEPTNADSQSTKYLAQGLLSGKIEALRIDAQAKSAVHNYLMNAVYIFIRTSDDAEVARKKLAGEVITSAERDDYEWMKVPELPQIVMQTMQRLDREIDFGTFNPILAGMSLGASATLGETALLTSAAQKKFINPGMQMDFMFTQICANILRSIDKEGKSVTVRGRTITPAMIRHNYSIEVKFEIVNPTQHLQEKQYAMSEVHANLRSTESYWEIARVTDTSEERRRLYRDMLMKDPRVQEMVINAVARGVGIKEMLDEIEVALSKDRERKKTFGGGGGVASGLVDRNNNPLQPTDAGPIRQPLGQEVGAPVGFKPGQTINLSDNGRQ
jgi:hypothetical protein